MDRFALLVTRLLRVSVALVSLMERDRVILPGMTGLPEPRAGRRALPPSHSLCRYVVASGQPLIVPDARADDRLHTDPAIAALGVIAYAGMPLTDADGLVLGSVCALAHKPRTWTDGEQGDLADLTAACSAEHRRYEPGGEIRRGATWRRSGGRPRYVPRGCSLSFPRSRPRWSATSGRPGGPRAERRRLHPDREPLSAGRDGPGPEATSERRTGDGARRRRA
ncbi:GAF domain-containing protein [Streptomyces sp. Ag109_G2-15]|uniref:GAF domain-containing protein n=1 Tax=Streptomyces sp. Ag109_G2-15 TaxID=1938850 RepID=UPI00211BEA12|nr:GAF domain-containing protein [Streptomyces sp. Ag109_G2-15]